MKLFLLNRQTANGGFNGRPEKLPDSCYVQWCGVPLRLLKVEFDEARLMSFVESCYDSAVGGFADRPEDAADIFHTCYCVGWLTSQVHLVYNVRLDYLADLGVLL